MNTVTLACVLLVLAVVLYASAPRQAADLARRVGARRPGVPLEGLAAELTRRYRLAAVGGGVGTVLGAVALLVREPTRSTDGPEGLADVAVLLTTTIVVAVLAEASAAARRSTVPSGPRVASLDAREAHLDGLERLGEWTLVTLAVLTLGLSVVVATQDVRGAVGAVGSAVGSLVVIGVCAVVRRRVLAHAIGATDEQEATLASAASAASADRFTDNLVGSGGVLALSSLLVPAVAAGPGSLRTTAIALGVAIVAAMAALVLARHDNRTRVSA